MDGIDVMRMAYLVGDLVRPVESVGQRRRMLLEGLAEWIGADAWLWVHWKHGRAHGEHHGLSSSLWDGFASLRKWPVSTEALATQPGMGDACGLVRETDFPAGVALFRKMGRPPFTPRERLFAAVVLEEVSWLYRDNPTAAENPDVRLSPRQTTIATLLLQGLGRKEIADRLGISPNTLTSYIRGIYRAFGVRSHAAFIKACQSGELSG